MSVKVRIPTPLRPLVGNQADIAVAGATVMALIESIDGDHEGFKGRLCDDANNLRRFINLYLNDEDIRYMQGLDTPVQDGDTLSIIPAIAGGSGQSFPGILAELKKTHREISAQEVRGKQDGGDSFLLLDVRESEEFRQGHLPGAIHAPRGFLEMKIEAIAPARDTALTVYCAGGVRSLLACETLKNMGYTNLESMAGGFGDWKQKELPIETPKVLSDKARSRYSRHISIPEVGEKGQLKLLGSKVLLIGAGGLGCPSAYYLAAAGVGTLGIVDFDVVDESNLQRQILHTPERVGTPKISSALKTLKTFSPDIELIPFEERLTSANIESIIKDFDVVVDGTDNFPTRYLINDACVKLKKPCVHGSVYRFEGQVTVFDPAQEGPCYRCLYKEPPPAELAPSCAEAGVLGVLPGVVGLLQAVETLKILLGIGASLRGKLLTYDALEASFQTFKLRQNPECDYCAAGKEFPGYIDYEHFCLRQSA
ncbi:MAG: molybdopterin-synthase adenylyltransferase MoeB [Myxococcota bacterium]|jgi:molybdopterin/thiamine biosynthesis adenylyltransferase/rhodanese-related sulfurtransferase/molybdopterin converting factor small subunit|nr:molybdopterin-synthase adenylyltransferase MoeB [Myxococcota bacterium]